MTSNSSNSTNSSSSWELSQSLLSIDGLGVRCAAALPPLPTTVAATTTTATETEVVWYRLVTGNQGGGIVEYSIPSGTIQVLDNNQHNHTVTAIISSWQHNIYITACKDGSIRIYHSTTHTLIVKYVAHEKPITSLTFCNNDGKERYIVTGSWDGTAKVWDLTSILKSLETEGTLQLDPPKLIATLPNHENSVCVASLNGVSKNGTDMIRIVTGSAGIAQGNAIRDHTVRIWNIHITTGEVTVQNSVSNDHDGPIRDIISTFMSTSTSTNTTPTQLLATCSNDGTIHLRDPTTGTTTSTLVFSYEEHPPMLLSLTYTEISVASSTATGDNAMMMKMISDTDNSMTGTLVTGAEAGHVVFFDYQTMITSGQPQIIRHADCVWNVITLPNHDIATCCQDGIVRIFTCIPERMATIEERQQFTDTVNAAIQALQNGPTSDEVMKLHPWHLAYEKRGTTEGQVHLFNKNNTAIAAQWSMDSQTWIEVGQVTGQAGQSGSNNNSNILDGVPYDHILPIEIEQTNGNVSTLQIGYNNGENPYTAGQRFIDTHMLPQSYLSQIAEYITQRVGKQPMMLGMTSSSTTTTPNTSGAYTGTPMAHYEYIPGKVYKTFDLVEKTATETFEKMKQKIQEFGCTDDKGDITNIASLMSTLQAQNRYHSSKVSDNELQSLLNLFTLLSNHHSFPALDLARLTVLHPDASTVERTKNWNSILQSAIILCQTDPTLLVDDNGSAGPAITAVPMLSLRLFCNAIKGGTGSRTAVVEHLNDVLLCATKHVSSTNKNIRLSVSTLLYNICIYLHQYSTTISSDTIDVYVPLIVGLVVEILNAKVPYENEALTRTMIAMGTITMISSTAKNAFNSNYLASKVEPLASPHSDVTKMIAKEVYNILS